MYLEDLDEVSRLQRHRKRYSDLRAQAEGGYCGTFEMGGLDVFSIIPADPVRKAIVDECDRKIKECDRMLHELGVNTAPKLVKREAPR